MSGQARDFGGDAAAQWQAATYASNGHLPGSCVSGSVRTQGYADPQVNPGSYQYAMSHGDGSQGVHSPGNAPGTEPTQETAEFGQGADGDLG